MNACQSVATLTAFILPASTMPTFTVPTTLRGRPVKYPRANFRSSYPIRLGKRLSALRWVAP
jgi:hypothetical protein